MYILHDIVTDDRIFLKSTLRIGRFQGDLKLKEDSQVSKSHCLIETLEDAVRITDLGSTNGTFVNKQRLNANEPRPLIPGDLIQIGRTEFKLEREDEPSFNVDYTDHSIKLTEDSGLHIDNDIDQGTVTGNIAKTEVRNSSPLPELDSEKKIDLNNPVHLSISVMVFLKIISMAIDGSFDFSSKNSPINFILAESIGLIAAGVMFFKPLRLWFHHFPKKVPGVIVAAIALLAVQSFTYNAIDQVLGLEVQKKVNRIYSDCLVKKNRKLCRQATAACPVCFEKLSQSEALKIQDFMSQVSDVQ